MDRSRNYPDNPLTVLNGDYEYSGDAPEGRIVTFTYETKNHLTGKGDPWEKSALVYLPPGFDETDTNTRYNILYLMHGGSDTPAWYFGGEGRATRLSRMLDSMIDSKDIEPLIVCAVSYYTTYTEDYGTNCLNFYRELMNDVIPLFESTYPGYAKGTSAEELAASRGHRAFGGFSMGAVATWAVFEHCLDSFKYFLPMSGDCWALGTTAGGTQSTMTALHLESAVKESGKTAKDFIIYTGCGENDIAQPNLTPQINAMKSRSDTFIYSDNFRDGNLYQVIIPGGGHDNNTVVNIMYNGLPKMFD